MTDYPILFSAPMVQALLADRKHVTRRLDHAWLKAKAGDRLWVRETWYCDDFQVQRGPFLEVDGAKDLLVYRADEERPFESEQPTWHPSIHMPRWASRILLECEEDARLELLQDIAELDAMAEGVDYCDLPDHDDCFYGMRGHRCAFERLWNTLHTEPGSRWEDNPEVVRVGRFRRLSHG
jgi:hypothetical protein